MFICSNCDSQFLKWQGRCPECGKWGTLSETTSERKSSSTISPPREIVSFSSVSLTNQEQRLATKNSEIDRVLGGGVVQGSLVLIGGEPGVGKSTLALQIAGAMPKCIYFSGEESAQQIKSRLRRLQIKEKNIFFSPEKQIEKIISLLHQEKPSLAIIDSIQTVFSEELPNEPGSIPQIRAATAKLLGTAKETNTAVVIIGHITKDGQVAGPKTLEHLVDTVAYLEGDEKESLRILRAKKNRFGNISEIGVFQMTATGLIPLADSSKIFLDKDSPQEAGMAIGTFQEGSRIFFVEVQALVNKTVFGYPQRRSFGFNLNRLQILSAVLTKKADINLNNLDINLNIVGGIKINDPALDLTVCLAIASAYFNKPLPSSLISIGEVGLGGEIRKVSGLSQRLKEGERLSFFSAIIPPSPLKKKNLLLAKNLKEAFHLAKLT